MGLTDRLYQSDEGTQDTPFARAMDMRLPRKLEHGDAAADPRGASSFSVDPGAAVRSLLRELHVQRNFGIATPSHLFSLLHRHLQVTAGTILVPESSGTGVYVPMASVGLDRTTRLRMKIPRDHIRQVCHREGSVTLRGGQRTPLQPYFSSRDFRTASRFVLLPFFHNRTLPAVLVICNSPLVALDLTILDVLLAALAERVGTMLFDQREKPLSAGGSTTVLQESNIPEILQRLQGEEVVLVQFSLEPAHALIMERHPHLDAGFLMNDLQETTARLCGNHFSMFRTATFGECLLAGKQQRDIDSEMVMHLISETLQQLFGVNTIPPLAFEERDAADLAREPHI